VVNAKITGEIKNKSYGFVIEEINPEISLILILCMKLIPYHKENGMVSMGRKPLCCHIR
jgi:hypothetical protein